MQDEPGGQLISQSNVRKSGINTRKRLLFTSLLTATLIGSIIFSFIQIQKHQFLNQIPNDIRSKVNFTFYLPNDDRFKVKKDSIKLQNNILIYELMSGNLDFTITQNAKTADFDLESFRINQGLLEARNVETINGLAIAGKALSKDMFILIAPKTIVILVNQSNDNTGQLEALLNSLKPVN